MEEQLATAPALIPKEPSTLAPHELPDRGSHVSRGTKAKIHHAIREKHGENIANSTRDFSLDRPRITKIISIYNPQTATGKSSLTANLAVALAHGGLKVLVLDLSNRADSSLILGLQSGHTPLSQALSGEAPLLDAVQPSPDLENLWGAASDKGLACAELDLAYAIAGERHLAKALDTYLLGFKGAERFDYVLIDTPSSLSSLTLNALYAAEEVLIPFFGEARECSVKTIEAGIDFMRTHLKEELRTGAIINRAKTGEEAKGELPASLGKTYNTVLPESREILLAEAERHTVFLHAPASAISQAYRDLAQELNKKPL